MGRAYTYRKYIDKQKDLKGKTTVKSIRKQTRIQENYCCAGTDRIEHGACTENES